ncbi:MAG: peptidylprolyl isomerase [Kangiellaceae bacterium]|jgi:cyclophilin family peptidyl-prolyl cis-trans isomerase|nr:peptidylprolyl isomerase [Kangiellaceae bacterium]
MAQGGDPTGTGTGGPGYKYDGEFSDQVIHDRPYLLSMANAGPGTDGSQFFITFRATRHLDGKHSIFGEVIEGQAVVDAMEALGSRSGRTEKPIIIEQASISIE